MSSILIVILSFLTIVISAIPTLLAYPKGIYFGFDPDVVYVSNALSHLKLNVIGYTGHPGTPTIKFIAQSFFPLRLYSNLIAKQSFIDWAFLNYDFIFLYVRLLQALLFGTATLVISLAIWRFTKSRLAILSTWITFLTFWPAPYLGSIIAPETLSVFLASTWLLVLCSYVKKRSTSALLFLLLLSGISFANKTTNLSLIFSSLVLSLIHYRHHSIFRRFVYIGISILVIIGGLFLGIWPVYNRLLQIVNMNLKFASHTSAHGAGKVAFLDIQTHFANINTFQHQNPVLLPLISIGLILAVYCLISKTKKMPMEIGLIFLSTFLIFFGFFKFQLFHYQITNVLVLIFLSILYISTFYRQALFLLCLISFWFIPVSIQRYYKEVNQLSAQTITLENFISSHPPKVATVWEWGRSRDFAYIWSRGWGGGILDPQLKFYKPNLFELSDFETINLNYRYQKPVFETCWDQLYIQQRSVEKFASLYPDQPINTIDIPGTTMALITSNHCQKK